MADVIAKRMTATMDKPFVVFLIGMRFNKPWKFWRWWQVTQAMPRMLQELYTHKELGFLGAHAWFGRTVIVLQYWNSYEQLEAYATMRDRAHLPAWHAFNKAVGSNGDVGIWHETYLSAPGQYENIYNNMPPFGLGAVGALAPVSGKRERAGERLKGAP
jgi:hypothetical protein